jgi:Lon protease-like protein
VFGRLPGRITSFAETGDGRYVITLGGVCRFRVGGEEMEKGRKPYRSVPDFTVPG